MCLYAEAGAFLVRHRGSRVLSEPWPRSEDETLGEVNPHLINFEMFFFFFVLFQIHPSTCSLLLSVYSDGTFMSTAEHIRLPDDCTVGYIVEALLGASLIRSALFHSHLENLGLVSDINNQVYTHKQKHTQYSLLLEILFWSN